MGRGRAKAKQTKVARDLKYRSVETDFERLQRELQGENYVPPSVEVDEDDEDDEYAEYADLYADDEDDDEDEDDALDGTRSS